MIGHYLLSLSREAQVRILTQTMRPGSYFEAKTTVDAFTVGPCLVGTGDPCGVRSPSGLRRWPAGRRQRERTTRVVEEAYDELCMRAAQSAVARGQSREAGWADINRRIRQRILTIWLWQGVTRPMSATESLLRIAQPVRRSDVVAHA